MKKFYFLGLAMLFGAIGVGHAQQVQEIATFEDLQKVGEIFSNARTVNTRVAEKNKELDAAKKVVETAEGNLSAAKSKQTEWENKKDQAVAKVTDLEVVQKPAAKQKWENEKAKLPNLEKAFEEEEGRLTIANTRWENAKDKLEKYKIALENCSTALKNAKENKVDVKKQVAQSDIAAVKAFIEAISDNTKPAKEIYYWIDVNNYALYLSTTQVNDKFQLVSTDTEANNSYTIKWSNTVLANADGIDYIGLYYQLDGNYKSKQFSINTATTLGRLTTRLQYVFNDLTYIEITVQEIDQDAINRAQADLDAQTELVEEQELVVAEAKIAVDTQQRARDNAATAVTTQKGVIETAEKEYKAYDDDEEGNPGLISQARAEVTAAENEIKTAKAKVAEAQGALDEANAEVTRIENEIETIKADADKVNEYKSLSITANIDVTDGTFTLGDWGSDYTIAGNGNVITYPAGANGALTGINRGMIINLGVVNGKIATTNGGSIKTAFETMDQNTYDLYDAAGTYTTSPISGELGYKVRQYFGLTINADGTLGTLDKKADDNIVYKAQWTDPVTKEIKTFYANEKEDNLSYNPTAGKKNMFVYVQDTDMKSTLEKSTNVVVNGVCANALFDDKTSEANNDRVYIPTGFTAKKLSYNRNFAKTNTYATVCLPFSVPATVYKAMGVTKIMQFNEIDNNNVYWFQYQEGSMNANEPYVLKFDEDNFGGGTIFNALEEIEIAATGNINPYAVAPENPGRGAEFLGLFLATNASTLAPAGSYNMYGFAEGRFRPIASTSPCQAFRTFVRTPKTSNAPATDLVIGELDELGNVVSGGTTGVNAAVADADAFSVKGGNGAVIITTGKAQKVSVYTVGGSLVKAANVEAGTVTVPVAAGVYIVNGKKVVVK